MSETSSATRELKRGWPIILAAAVGVGTGRSPLPIYSLGIFTLPIAAEFGWGRGDIQTVLTFATMGALIGSPLVGALMDRIGVRLVVLVSTVLFGITFGAIGLFTNSLFAFYAISFLSSILGAGTLPVTWSRAILDWFRERRGLALGLALTGTGFAAFLVPPYTTWLVQNVGWRYGYVGLALLPIVLSLPLTWFLLKPAPKRETVTGQKIEETGFTLREAARTYRFWVIGFAFFLASIGTGGIVAHLVPMLTDRGYDLKTAAWVAGAQGLAVIAGRAITGYFLDRVWAPALAAFLVALPAASCLILATDSPSVPLATAAVILNGFAAGAEFDLVAFLAARYFGMRHFGAIYGVLYAIFVSASGVAPGMFGRVFDATGSYAIALHIGAATFIAGALVVLTLGRYPPEFAPTRH